MKSRIAKLQFLALASPALLATAGCLDSIKVDTMLGDGGSASVGSTEPSSQPNSPATTDFPQAGRAANVAGASLTLDCQAGNDDVKNDGIGYLDCFVRSIDGSSLPSFSDLQVEVKFSDGISRFIFPSSVENNQKSEALIRIPIEIAQAEMLASVTLTATGSSSINSENSNNVQIAVATAIKPSAISATLQAQDLPVIEEVATASSPTRGVSSWPFAKKINLDTTANGANISAALQNYPLAVRLDSSILDFSQVYSSSNGMIIRFYADDNLTVLDSEVESWDTASSTALVWVKIPSVIPNANKFITMVWGLTQKDAVTEIAVGKVFATNTFAAVFHLSSDNNSEPDATANSFTAANDGTNHEIRGMLGAARYFPGNGKRLSVGNPNQQNGDDDSRLEPTNLTLSAWIKTDGVQNEWARIIQKGCDDVPFGSYALSMGDPAPSADPTKDLKFQVAVDPVASWTGAMFTSMPNANPNPGAKWLFVSASFNSATSESNVYVDGNHLITQTWYNGAVKNDITPRNIEYFNTNNNICDNGRTYFPLLIGAANNADPKLSFKGWLDEVRLANIVLPADWLKLDFESQRNGQKFYSFAP